MLIKFDFSFLLLFAFSFDSYSSYAFKRNEKIIGFFEKFEECFDEDVMWQISEKIKPRISRKVE